MIDSSYYFRSLLQTRSFVTAMLCFFAAWQAVDVASFAQNQPNTMPPEVREALYPRGQNANNPISQDRNFQSTASSQPATDSRPGVNPQFNDSLFDSPSSQVFSDRRPAPQTQSPIQQTSFESAFSSDSAKLPETNQITDPPSNIEQSFDRNPNRSSPPAPVVSSFVGDRLTPPKFDQQVPPIHEPSTHERSIRGQFIDDQANNDWSNNDQSNNNQPVAIEDRLGSSVDDDRQAYEASHRVDQIVRRSPETHSFTTGGNPTETTNLPSNHPTSYSGATLEQLLNESNQSIQNNRPNRSSDSASDQSAIGSSRFLSFSQPDDSYGISEQTGQHQPIQFADQLQRIAISLCIVLMLGVGFVVTAKRWFAATTKTNPNRPTQESSNRQVGKIEIQNHLRLDSKSSLYLVAAGEQQVLVAVDAAGIKSVVALSPSFDDLLGPINASNETNERYLPSQAEPQDFAVSLERPDTYSPAARRYLSPQLSPQPESIASSNSGRQRNPEPTPQTDSEDIEAEMRRKLAELLGGEAFRDILLKQTDRK